MVSIRKIGVLGRTYRNLNRYRQILTILFKYGFGDLVERLRIEQYIESGLKIISKNRREYVDRYNRAQRFRMLLEELGPAFIKLGQILSTRPDLVPLDVMLELEKLQDHVPPFEFDEAKKIVSDEFGKDVSELFTKIDEEPIASASIGQVHKAELNGEILAVKIQRPGIRRIVDTDLEIMLHLATLIENNIEEAKLHNPVSVVEEFARSIKRELDYTIEANNMERVASNFLKDSNTYIPKVYNDLSGKFVLTMEFIDGIKISEIEEIDRMGLSRKKITKNGAGFVLKQIFEDGFFHADPHPGNIFVLGNNVICPVDYGMTGSIDERNRNLFMDVLDSVSKKDPVKTAKLILEIGECEDEPKINLFENDIHEFMERHLYKSLKDMEIGDVLNDFLVIATKHRIKIPSGIFLMMKAFVSLDGVARLLDPDFDMIGFATPYVARAKLKRYSPKRITEDFFTTVTDSIHVFQTLPKELLETIKLARKNRLTINMELTGLDNFIKTHDQVSNRLSFAVVTAALIIGSALLLAFNTPPLFYGVSIVGIIGFSIAALFGLWLLIAIVKRGMM